MFEVDVSYSQWQNEFQCSSSECLQSDHLLGQAITHSLKGFAADILLSLEKCSMNPVLIENILSKFQTVFGNVLSPATLLEQFHNTKPG